MHNHNTEGPDGGWPPRRLTVIYDDHCELCIRCSRWMSEQPTHVEMRFLPSSDPQVFDLYGELPWYRLELMVITDTGAAWVGSSAFIMCLWATMRYHQTSYRLSGSALAPLAERFFHTVSSNRSTVSGMLRPSGCDDGSCSNELSIAPMHPVDAARS